MNEIITRNSETRRLYLNSIAENTRRAYRADMRDFTTWILENDPDPENPTDPHNPTTLALIYYITDLNTRGLKASTITRRLAGLHAVYKEHHQTPIDPFQDPSLAAVLKGIRRDQDNKPTQKKAITTAQIRDWLRTLTDSTKDNRDRAVILTGFSTGMRRSELAALQIDDLQFTDTAIRITIRESKTDKDHEGQEVYISRTDDPLSCPYAALIAWIETAEITTGPLFRPVTKSGNIQDGGISEKTIARIVKGMAASLGLDPKEYSGHSLRSGMITQATINNCPRHIIKEQSRHKTDQAFDRYYRPAEKMKNNVSSHLGL